VAHSGALLVGREFERGRKERFHVMTLQSRRTESGGTKAYSTDLRGVVESKRELQ